MHHLRCRVTPDRVFTAACLAAQHGTERKADASWYSTALQLVGREIIIHRASLSVAIMCYAVRESWLDSSRAESASKMISNLQWSKSGHIKRTKQQRKRVEISFSGRAGERGTIQTDPQAFWIQHVPWYLGS